MNYKLGMLLHRAIVQHLYRDFGQIKSQISPIYFDNGLVVGICTAFLPIEELAFGVGMKTIGLISAMSSRMVVDYIVDPLHKTQKKRDGSLYSPYKSLKEVMQNVGRDATIGFVGSIVYDYEAPFNFWEYFKNRFSLKALGSGASFIPKTIYKL